MLTKQDLNAIGNVIDERLESKLEDKLKPIRKDINKIQKTLDKTIDHFNSRCDELKNSVVLTRNELSLEEIEFVY